jgi:CubicO group peptidase (beta-lactamase class C family)
MLAGAAAFVAARPAAARPAAAQTLPSGSIAPALAGVLDQGAGLAALETMIVARGGTIVAERGYRGHRVNAPTNIKSASKAVISALVGIAIDRGILAGVDQPIAPLLRADLPANPDPRLGTITIGNLLSMQSGLQRTSGANYGRWVASRNWVRAVLAEPFVDEPGGRMLYSTGSTHLLSAILTRATGRPTLALARDWLHPVAGFAIADWARDPQGIYIGGNQMAVSPRALLAFGELYRNGGRTAEGTQVVPERWVQLSWTPRTASPFTGDAYGYGWFLRQVAGSEVKYVWGYGGQMLYIVPARALTVVMTSADNNPAARTGYRDALNGLMAQTIAALA